jgi:hypothetical protein
MEIGNVILNNLMHFARKMALWSTPYMPEQNGVHERNNWTLVEMDFGLCFKRNIKNVIMGKMHFDENVNHN